MAPSSRSSAKQNDSTKTIKPASKQARSNSVETTSSPQQALAQPLGSSPQQVLQLQSAGGNRAVQRLIQRAQSNPPAGLEGGPVDGGLQQQIETAQGGGQTLDTKVGSKIGNALGADFSNVRVHTDKKSDALNRSLNATAFTLGKDVFFSEGAYNPASSGGQKLLAHELTHVVQQSAASEPQTSQPSLPSVSRAMAQRSQPVSGRIQLTRDTDGNDINWTNVSQATPSSEGAMGGVFFLKIGTTVHVIKSTDNPAAALFAEQVVEDVGGAVSTKSQPVLAASDEGRAILAAIETHPPVRKDGEGDQDFIARQTAHTSKLNIFKNAKYLMVQRAMSGTQLGFNKINDEVKENERLPENDPKKVSQEVMSEKIAAAVAKQIAILENETAIKNIGRVLAADTLVGNADRFEQMNTGNAFITDDGKVGAIDTEAILQEFNAFVNFANGPMGQAFKANQEQQATTADYTNFLTTTGGRNISDSGQAAPSSAVASVTTDFDNWFQRSFANTYYTWKHQSIKDAMAVRGYPQPEKNAFSPKWQLVHSRMKAGLNEGIARVSSAMSGAGLRNLKVMFNLYNSTYGKDGGGNFNLNALKVKGRYMKSHAEGGTGEQAYGAALNYARYVNEYKPKYRQNMDAITTLPHSLVDVPQVPPELSKSEKMKRAFSINTSKSARDARANAKRLKEKSRQGIVDPELEAQVRESANLSGRRADKALYELQFRRFQQGLSARAQLLVELDLDIRRFHAQSIRNDATSEIATKKLAFVRRQFDSGDRGGLFNTQTQLGLAVGRWNEQVNASKNQELADPYHQFTNAHQFILKRMK